MESQLLRSINQLWMKRKVIAQEFRDRDYNPVVRKIDRYYHSRKRFLFVNIGVDPDDEPFPTPRAFHRVSIAKTGEFVRLMLPYVFFQVPVRSVKPRARQIPDDVRAMISAAIAPAGMVDPLAPQPDPTQGLLMQGKVQSYLAEYLLNYAADDATYNLRGESRKATQEALIAGRGLLWHELVETPNGFFPGSFFESHYNLLVDPDHDDMMDANYIMRKRRRPAWEIAEEFGLPLEKIRAHAKSYEQIAKEVVDPHAYSTEDQKDICEYYEVYSRMGVGQRIETDEDVRKQLEQASSFTGDHVYLACMDGIDHPLNLDPDKIASMSNEEVVRQIQWPIAFFGDHNDPWPCTKLDFYDNGIYPKPPLEDALPLQSFLDFAYFYLQTRIKATSRNILFVPQDASEKLKQALESGFDNEIVELKEKYPDIAKMVYQLKFDPVNPDLWRIIEAVETKWEESTGVNALVRGGNPDKMMRSSAEAQIRQTNSQIRPDDMRDCVQAWQGAVARKEHIAQRLVMRKGVATYFGEDPKAEILGPLTEAWMKYVATDDYWTAAQELAVTIEGSTGRRRNKESQINTLTEMGQILVPLFIQYYQATGDPSKVNAYLSEFFDVMDTPDPGRFMFPEQAPPPSPAMLSQEQPPANGAAPAGPPGAAPPDQPPPAEQGAANPLQAGPAGGVETSMAGLPPELEARMALWRWQAALAAAQKRNGG